MLLSLSTAMSGKTKSTPYTTDRSSSSPDYRSESSSTSPLHMTNLDSSNRVGGTINGPGVNGHDVTTLTSSTARSGHYTHHNNNNVIKETMINSSTLSSSTNLRNNMNSIYNLDPSGLSSIPYNTSSRRVPDVHTNIETYDNSNDYKLIGSNANATETHCHELKKWSEVSSVDKIGITPRRNGVTQDDEDTKINGLNNTKRRTNCNNDTNNNSNDNHLPR